MRQFDYRQQLLVRHMRAIPKTSPPIEGISAGALVISLDFELHWGVRDLLTVDQYRANLAGVREAIPAMLKLFDEFGIHATWATVGFLFFETKRDLLRAIPPKLPQYVDANLSPYPQLGAIGDDEVSDPFHFAPSLIRMIQKTAGQEIASHTFSHFYCAEPGQDLESFEADLIAAQAAAQRCGVVLRTLVLPRNQINPEYLPACAKAGFKSYRGNGSGWWVKGVPIAQDTTLRRLLRLSDAYLPIQQWAGIANETVDATHPVNVPASRFLRPWTPGARAVDALLVRRIRQELTTACESSGVYHLWWHPHNFGAEPAENIRRLRTILEHFADLRRTRGMQSFNMAEVAELVLAEQAAAVVK